VRVLFPPDSLLAGRRLAIAYFQDGLDYLEKASAADLLANLSREPGMPLIAGVFVPPADRLREYGLTSESEAYADFLARVLVPAIEGSLATAPTRVLIGPSLGGLISVYAALRYPDVFPKVASQSGAFWYSGQGILGPLSRPAMAPLDLFFETGTYESARLVEQNRVARDAARQGGHRVRYEEYPSTHDWIAWRNRLGLILRHFLGDARSGMRDEARHRYGQPHRARRTLRVVGPDHPDLANLGLDRRPDWNP
jgi:enterochelin esterase-like enzyme